MSVVQLPATQPPNLFDLYFNFVQDTESPLIYHRWSLITCLSAMLARQCWIPFGSARIFPNQYVMLIGEPGARKSSAIKLARKLFSAAGYKNFAATKTTKEKFLLDLEGLEEQSDEKVSNTAVMQNLFGEKVGDEPREVFIVADEFNDFMRCCDLEFHSMLGALWDWDDESVPYEQRLKNSRSISIFQPTVTLLGGNTHTGFAEMFPPQAIGQGFLSRLLLIFSEPSNRKIAWPTTPSPEDHLRLVKEVEAIRAVMHGPLAVTSKAREMLTVLYNNYEGFADVRFTSYFTRRHTHLLKLCILCAAVRKTMLIGAADVILANSMLRYAEHYMPKALGEFGKAKNSDVANKLLQYLSKFYKPVDIPELWKQVSSDLDRQEDLARMLEGLRTAGKIQWVPKKQTTAQGFLLTRKPLAQSELYTDYSLLREADRV